MGIGVARRTDRELRGDVVRARLVRRGTKMLLHNSLARPTEGAYRSAWMVIARCNPQPFSVHFIRARQRGRKSFEKIEPAALLVLKKEIVRATVGTGKRADRPEVICAEIDPKIIERGFRLRFRGWILRLLIDFEQTG